MLTYKEMPIELLVWSWKTGFYLQPPRKTWYLYSTVRIRMLITICSVMLYFDCDSMVVCEIILLFYVAEQGSWKATQVSAFYSCFHLRMNYCEFPCRSPFPLPKSALKKGRSQLPNSPQNLRSSRMYLFAQS